MTQTAHAVAHSFDEKISDQDCNDYQEEMLESDNILDKSETDLKLPSTLTWHVTSVAGKGLGLVAKVDMPVGTLILTDKPLFVVPNHVHQPDPNVLNLYLETAVSSLTQDEIALFYSLSDIKSGSGQKTARGIYFTNCFTLGHGPDAPTGLLPLLARANHSCVPNTEFHWNQEDGWEELRTTADVKAGEELVDCYLDLTAEGRITRKERWELLKGGYGFECNCEACSLEGEDREEDDRLRTEVFHLSQIQSSTRASSEAELDSLLERGDRWLARLADMRYKVVHQLVAVETLFYFAMMAGQTERAVAVADRGVWLAMVRYGEDSKHCKEWKARKLNPVAYVLG